MSSGLPLRLRGDGWVGACERSTSVAVAARDPIELRDWSRVAAQTVINAPTAFV
jgi:hypothetical protein